MGMLCLGMAQLVPAQIDGTQSAEGSFTVPDSLKTDSTLVPQKEVDILTEIFDLQRFVENRYARREVKPDLDEVMYFDQIQRLDGFVMSLGQIGKPYKRYRYGLDASFLNTGLFQNPYTRQEDIYMIDPARMVRYYDTRTPYIDIYYGQGKGNLSALRVEVAQNITPWWNVSAMFRRELAEGEYASATTDHYNVYLGTNFRTKNDRYHLFLNGTFQQFRDFINGGSDPTGTELTNNSFFNGGAQPMILSEASLSRVSRAAYFQQFYRIIPDTVDNPHRLVIYNSVQRDFFENQFTDSGIDPSFINLEGLFPVYPTITDSTTSFYERYRHNRWMYREGISYRYRTARLETGHQIFVTNELVDFEKNLQDFRWDKLTRSYEGDFAYRPEAFQVEFDWQLHRTTSNFFAPERNLEAEARFSFPKEKVDYTYYKEINNLKEEKSKDSVLVSRKRRPFTVIAGAMLNDRNPSLQQSFGDGWFGTNSFQANRDLLNHRVELYRVGIEARTKDIKTKYGHYDGQRVRLTAYQSRQRNPIYYGPAMELIGGGDTARVDFTGIEVSGHLRWKKFNLSGQINYQIPDIAGDTVLTNYYMDNQPHYYAKGSLYWEKHDIKIARAIRTGIDYFYQPFYFTPLFDPVSQQFYPQNSLPNSGFLFPPDYHRVDVFFSAQIKRAQFFARFYNVLDGVFGPGYFTTFGYPMWDRDFQIGVVWTFFD